jgi:hypothetical protein
MVMVLALSKLFWLRKQLTKVTYKPTLRLEASPSNLEGALSCHLISDRQFFLIEQWLGFQGLSGFDKVLLARRRRMFFGLWSQILKTNETNVLVIEPHRGT